MQGVLALDDDEWEAYGTAVAEHVRRSAWSNEHELLAACVELLAAVLGELQRGVPVVMTKQQRKAGEPFKVTRPAWVVPMTPDQGEIVVGPRQLMTMLSKG